MLPLKVSPLMRILLDENFPADFEGLLVGHEVLTVHNLGWSGIKIGEHGSIASARSRSMRLALLTHRSAAERQGYLASLGGG
jgi:hypothetical protein